MRGAFRTLLAKVALAGACCGPLGSLSAHAQQAGTLTLESARSLVAPFYGALTASSPDVVGRLLEQVTTPEWRNCATNDVCEARPAVIRRWAGRISVVPDMNFTEKDVTVAKDRIIVRSEVQGTPAAPFFGVQPSGRSFRIMTLDIHEVSGGKIVTTYHMEDWARAIRQLSGVEP